MAPASQNPFRLRQLAGAGPTPAPSRSGSTSFALLVDSGTGAGRHAATAAAAAVARGVRDIPAALAAAVAQRVRAGHARELALGWCLVKRCAPASPLKIDVARVWN